MELLVVRAFVNLSAPRVPFNIAPGIYTSHKNNCRAKWSRA